LKIINVILSGGVGSRLWPLSRKSKPKQYLPLFEGQTLFQKTALRNRNFCEKILVVGNIDNYNLSRKDLAQAGIKEYQEIIEACPRNTAAAIAFAAFSCEPSDILFVTPSDHLIGNQNLYQKALIRAFELAKEGYLVTFGLKPSRPDTGFGYIESQGEQVKSFREKPDLERAIQFIDAGNFYWNSGMFCFQAGVFLEELEKLTPEVYKSSKEAIDHAIDGKLHESLSLRIPSISVDYAVMEKTDRIRVVPSEFTWSDMGSFEAIYDHFVSEGYPTDESGNMVIGEGPYTEFLGLKECILVNTPECILVLDKNKAQDVKKVFERLEVDKPHLIN
jgi:mannose-1-phosphate guanylyltransferase